MLKNNTIRRLSLLISLIMLLTSTVNTTFGFIVTKTDSLVNTFVPFESIISNLLINKKVEHPFGEEYVIPDDIAFDFKVDFGSLYANTTIKTTAGDVVADENGSIQISVKPEMHFAVEGIDAGTKVTVTEIQKDGSGFAVKNGADTLEGVVAEDGSLKFEYVNVYTPESVSPANVFVNGNKILEGRDWQDGDSFSFKLEQKQKDGSWTVLGTETVTYSADDAEFNRFDFTHTVQALTFDKVGVYEFRMSEVVGEFENVDYDKSVNTFAIRVTDVDMDGRLEINTVSAAVNAKVNEADGNYYVDVTFNNTFVPVIPDPEDITVKIFVDKTVNNTGTSSIGPEGFEFVLENTESGEKRALKSDENGDAVFSLPFTSADAGKTFTYKLSEKNGKMTGVTYDTKVYDISVYVVLGEDNKLIAGVSINGQITENPVAEFVNTYHAKLPDTPPTSDNGNTEFWLIMMIISGFACVFLAITEKKYRETEK